MRDEPGIGAFVVDVKLERESSLRALDDAEIARLRASKKVVGDRARAVLILRTTMPAPQIHAVPGGPAHKPS